MPDPQRPGELRYDYSLERAKVLYALLEKPADMTDHEWAIVSDEGFRKYIATTIGMPYVTRQELKNRAQ